MKVFKSLVCLCAVLGLLVILTGCPNSAHKEDAKDPQGMVYFNYFDTVSYIYSYAGDSQESFDKRSDGAAEVLGEYHRLFDIYYEYSGVNNLCTVNKNAGGQAVKVDEALIDFLLYAKQLHEKKRRYIIKKN